MCINIHIRTKYADWYISKFEYKVNDNNTSSIWHKLPRNIIIKPQQHHFHMNNDTARIIVVFDEDNDSDDNIVDNEMTITIQYRCDADAMILNNWVITIREPLRCINIATRTIQLRTDHQRRFYIKDVEKHEHYIQPYRLFMNGDIIMIQFVMNHQTHQRQVRVVVNGELCCKSLECPANECVIEFERFHPSVSDVAFTVCSVF